MNILAFGAHPDDIEIGVGGTLAKYAEERHNIAGIIATLPPQKIMRRKESEIAAKVLDIGIEVLDIEFGDLYSSRELTKRIDMILEKYSPDVIFTHWNGDSHQDHNALTGGVISATRRNKSSVYMYEQTLPGGIVADSFNAQLYVDISNTMEKKINSIMAHKSQHGRNGDWWLDGIQGRAMFRGYQINVKYAEAFQVVKRLGL